MTVRVLRSRGLYRLIRNLTGLLAWKGTVVDNLEYKLKVGGNCTAESSQLIVETWYQSLQSFG
jgi:hypothetical protein